MVDCHGVAGTTKAGKYLQQLCKHFAHKVPAIYDEASGRVEFPVGLCLMTADEQELTFFCRADQTEGLQIMQVIIDNHLKRFAWREALETDWRPGLPGSLPDVVADGFASTSGSRSD